MAWDDPCANAASLYGHHAGGGMALDSLRECGRWWCSEAPWFHCTLELAPVYQTSRRRKRGLRSIARHKYDSKIFNAPHLECGAER